MSASARDLAPLDLAIDSTLLPNHLFGHHALPVGDADGAGFEGTNATKEGRAARTGLRTTTTTAAVIALEAHDRAFLDRRRSM